MDNSDMSQTCQKKTQTCGQRHVVRQLLFPKEVSHIYIRIPLVAVLDNTIVVNVSPENQQWG